MNYTSKQGREEASNINPSQKKGKKRELCLLCFKMIQSDRKQNPLETERILMHLFADIVT